MGDYDGIENPVVRKVVVIVITVVLVGMCLLAILYTLTNEPNVKKKHTPKMIERTASVYDNQ